MQQINTVFIIITCTKASKPNSNFQQRKSVIYSHHGKVFWLYFFITLGTGRELALASYEFVGEQSRREENMKHVPSCTSPNEGVGCV